LNFYIYFKTFSASSNLPFSNKYLGDSGKIKTVKIKQTKQKISPTQNKVCQFLFKLFQKYNAIIILEKSKRVNIKIAAIYFSF